MRTFDASAATALLTGTLIGAGALLLAQTPAKPRHDRVPPYREPSSYMSQADIQAALDQLDPKLLSSRTGGAVEFAKGKAPGVVRRRVRGPQYAITHTRTLEYMIQDASHLSISFGAAVTVVHACTLFIAWARAHPRGEMFR
jgi:hypothetical protein